MKSVESVGAADPFAAKDNNFAAFGEDNFGESKTTGFDDSFGSAFNGNARLEKENIMVGNWNCVNALN